MITTKLTIEFEVSTQFGPLDAINMIDTLTRVPAIKSVNVVKLETDYDQTDKFLEDVNVKAINSIPKKIR